MPLLLGLQFAEQLPPIVGDELEQLTAAIQAWAGKLDGAGKWVSIAYASSLFWPDAGTWTPRAQDVRLLQYSVVGNRMVVAFHIEGAAASGTVTKLNIRVPTPGWVPVASLNPGTVAGVAISFSSACSIWEATDTYKPGIAAIVNGRTDSLVIQCSLTAEGNIAGSSLAGCFGQVSCLVQPAVS